MARSASVAGSGSATAPLAQRHDSSPSGRCRWVDVHLQIVVERGPVAETDGDQQPVGLTLADGVAALVAAHDPPVVGHVAGR